MTPSHALEQPRPPQRAKTRRYTTHPHASLRLLVSPPRPRSVTTDVANDPQNPYPGQLFNAPTDATTPGVDVYAGCKKDYTGDDVTAANVMSVLTGNSQAVSGVGTGRVLNTTSEDNVFINFVDHGATGLVAMPSGPYWYADGESACHQPRLATLRAGASGGTVRHQYVLHCSASQECVRTLDKF